MDDDAANLLAQWRSGEQKAADELFRRYADRLISLARSRLSGKLSQRIDPEDVVQSAYRSFFVSARAGQYSLECGGDLWGLLVAITLHKLQHQVARHTAEKRTIDRDQSFGGEDTLLRIQAQLQTREPSPVEAVALVDQVEKLMRGLEPLQRTMLELRLQGYTLYEIAEKTQRCRRTVIRTLEQVKHHLQEPETP